MVKRIVSIILALMLVASISFAGSGWKGDYQTRWDITVVDVCAGTTKVYQNCYITSQGEYHVQFMADQMRGGPTNGKTRTVRTVNDCISVTQEEAD